MFDLSKRANRDLIIAGENAGKPVYIVPAAKPTYEELVRLSRKGSHWARITVEGLHNLAHGRLNMANIFINPVTKGGSDEFIAVLPGCKVTIEKMSSDCYKILYFERDENYFTQEETNAAGLYRVVSEADGWDTRYIKDGRLKSEGPHHVAISDRGYEDASFAAEQAALRIANAPEVSPNQMKTHGFALHYTPGKDKIGGLVHAKTAFNPLNDDVLNASALQLAQTMYDARKIKAVNWVAEFGGSAVLTQAMRILADQGVELKTHTAYLYKPKSRTNVAVKQAMRLNLSINGDFSQSSALDIVGNMDALAVVKTRSQHDDSYRLGHATTAVRKFVAKAGAAGATGLAVAGAGCAAAGVSVPVISAAAIPAAVVFAGALYKAAKGAAGVGVDLLEVAAPETHDKMKKGGWV
ncbi:hypothetical protein EDC56_2812 [Sinobacterium caligoides]|uniref:Uncharacterized protein n=1 Tax=Sinobacterium caligoides TaxID=933926 RepID=A0A3N2DK57_9GAMM|nr:hypothetical protein [Sinobacterium caligoides]ROS00176.1 hypothetical protein EDC56_2812 [Sinobacterium caligoides]